MSPVTSRRPGGVLGVLTGVLVLAGAVVGISQITGGGSSNSCTLSDATGCAKQAGLTITWNNPTEANSDTGSILIRCTGSVLSYRPAGYISNPSSPDWTVSGSGYPVRWIINWPNSPDYIDRSGILLDSGCTATDDAGRGTRPNLIVNMGGDGINYGVEGDALKSRVGAHDIDITGSINCGPGNFNPATSTGVHPDGIQLVGGDNIDFYDVTVGNWASKQSTCEGSGGGFFISNAGGNVPTNIDVRRMKVIACNKGLNANAGDTTSTGSIANSFFRAGNPAEQTIPKANGLTGICQSSLGGIYTANVPANVPLWTFTNVAGQTYPYNEPFSCTQNQTTCLNVGGTTTANVFVSSTGSDTGSNCTRFSTPVIFPADQTTVCQTLDKADSLLQSGDAALIAGGTYGAQTILTHTGRTSQATATVVSGQTVTISGGLVIRADHLSLVGPFVTDGIGIAGTDAQDNQDTSGSFHANFDSLSNFTTPTMNIRGTHISLSNGDIGPFHACGHGEDGLVISALYYKTSSGDPSGNIQDSSSFISLDHVNVHDIDAWNNPADPSQGDCLGTTHVDGLQAFAGDNVTITNSKFWNNASSNILAKPEGTAKQVMRDWTITNSFFGPTLNGGNGLLLGADGQNCFNGGVNNFLVQNNTMSNTPVRFGCAGTPTVVRNNIIQYNFYMFDCSGPNQNATFTYNVWSAGSDAACRAKPNSQTCIPTWASPGHDTNGNLARAAGDTCATNKGDPANYTTPDIFGVARPIGSAPDAAADEQ